MDRLSCFDEVRKLLPKQGPLEFFVHHNTFHCFEGIPFKEGLKQGQLLYEGKVLKSEREYWDNYKSGSIDRFQIEKQIFAFCSDNKINDPTLKKLVHDLFLGQAPEGSQIVKLKPEFQYFEKVVTTKNKFMHFHLQQAYNIDLDEIISPLIFRFFSKYFDQGVAYWKMPKKDSLLGTFQSFYGQASIFSSNWEKKLADLITELHLKNAPKTIEALLKKFPLDGHEKEYFLDLGLRYKGWGGLVLSFEKHPEWNKRKDVRPNFEDFIAILMLCEMAYLLSLNSEKRQSLKKNVLTEVTQPEYSNEFLLNAQRLHQEIAGEVVFADVNRILQKLTDFDRRFIWHQAYEETYYTNFLKTFLSYQESAQENSTDVNLQVVCCIDDREESFRRHLEALGKDIETFGIAGHFGLDIQFKGLFSAHFRALCPDIIKPSKKISVKLETGHRARNMYGIWAQYLWLQSLSSKTLIRGLFFQILTGFVSVFSLSLSVISPYLNFKIGHYLKKRINQSITTKLLYDDPDNMGFTLEKMIDHAAGVLITIGLKENFAPVIAILGHGSHSLNNPHEAAHDCGACGGGRGAPNARLMATLLNRQDVREGLQSKGIKIPDKTVFVGGYHNTCSDEVLFFDVPTRDDVLVAIKQIRKAARTDALERCRKYEDVSLSINEDKAYKHCLGRAYNYMQPRPEYGHATNALCYVGPRWMSRGLFLDRRAFLTSYEPSQDPSAKVLSNILSAVGPVCSGINLEYYFSYMDNEVYGCGTKLPHNVTSLVGVMNGYQSDLRMGLPWQMVEIHDPYRLMLLVTCLTKNMEILIESIESLNKLVHNSWIHLAAYDPEKKKLFRLIDGQFHALQSGTFDAKLFDNSLAPFKHKREACSIGIVRSP